MVNRSAAQAVQRRRKPLPPADNPVHPKVPLGPSNDNPSGGGGDVFKLTLAQRVRGVEIGLGLLAAAAAFAFWFVMDRMDSRFDRMDDRTREVARDISTMKTDNARSFEQILVRLRDRS